MALIVIRNEDNQLINVRKYIIDDECEESIWSNDWYGRHIIGKDCVWANVSKVQSNCNLTHVINSDQLHVCKYCGAETTQPDEECFMVTKKATVCAECVFYDECRNMPDYDGYTCNLWQKQTDL